MQVDSEINFRKFPRNKVIISLILGEQSEGNPKHFENPYAHLYCAK